MAFYREVRRNMIHNSTFSRGTEGWSAEPITGTNKPTLTVTEKTLRFTTTTAMNGVRINARQHRLERGETFSATANVTAPTSAGRVRLVARSIGTNGSVTALAGTYVNLGTGVTPSITFTVPENETRLTVGIEFPDNGAYTATIQNVIMERGTTTGPFFDGDHAIAGYRNRWVGTADGWNSVLEREYVPTGRPDSGHFIVGNFLTGRVVARSNYMSSVRGELTLNSPGILSVDGNLPFFDPITGDTFRLPEQAVPWRDFIGWVENDELIFAGPLSGDTHTFPQHSITAVDPWGYFNRRTILPKLSDTQIPEDVITRWEQKDLGTLAAKLIAQSTEWDGGNVPIDWNPVESNGDWDGVWPGEDYTYIGDALTTLTETGEGVDFFFKPKWTQDDTHIRWELLSGKELSPGDTIHSWDTSVPDAWSIPSVLDRSGEDLATNSYVKGAEYRNLVLNPSFQDLDDEHNIDDWEAVDATLASTTNVIFDGDRAARLTVPGLTGRIESENKIRVLPETPYSAQAWCRAVSSSAQFRVRVQWIDAAENVIGTSVSPWQNTTVDGAWIMAHAGAVSPPKTTGAIFAVQMTNTTTGRAVYVGGTMLIEGDTAAGRYVRDSGNVSARASLPTLLDNGYPALDVVQNVGTITKASDALARAQDGALRGAFQVEVFSMKVKRDRDPVLGWYWPGDTARINFGHNNRISNEWHEFRILRVQFNEKGDNTIDFAPVRSVAGYKIPESDRMWLRGQLRGLSSEVKSNRNVGFYAY